MHVYECNVVGWRVRHTLYIMLIFCSRLARAAHPVYYINVMS